MGLCDGVFGASARSVSRGKMTVNHRFLRHLVYAWWKINKGGSLQTHENVFNILRWPRYILLTRYHSKMKTPTPYRIKRTTVQKQKTNSFPASHLSERYLPYGGRKKNKLYGGWSFVIRASVTKHKKWLLMFFHASQSYFQWSFFRVHFTRSQT